jgi:hypothetical protein
VTGPYETQRQAADTVRHITGSRVESWTDGCHRLIEDACTAAGVQLDAYDHRVLLWLAGWEPSTCAVIAGLIRRAHLAGKASTASSVPLDPGQLGTLLRALADAAAHRTGRADARCEDCLAHPAGCATPTPATWTTPRRTGPLSGSSSTRPGSKWRAAGPPHGDRRCGLAGAPPRHTETRSEQESRTGAETTAPALRFHALRFSYGVVMISPSGLRPVQPDCAPSGAVLPPWLM